MKITMSRVMLVSFFLFLSCFLYGCRSEKMMSDQSPNATEDTVRASSDKKNEERTGVENRVTSMSVGDKSVVHNYMLYVMNDGEVTCTKQVQKYMDAKGTLADVYQELMEELTKYIGYDVILNSVKVQKDQIYVDLSKESDIFHKEQFDETIEKPVKYSSYEEMALGILDSMCMTLQKNNDTQTEVFYSEDGEAMQFPDLSILVDFVEDEAYQGSTYYEQIYLSRAEGSITDFVDLGMSYNDVLLRLNQKEITTVQTEDFSMLGDHSSWENYQNVDDYLRNAWLHIRLSADSFEFIFDGPDTSLQEIKVTDKELPSSRGLYVGDTLTRLLELYGELYTMYVIDGSLLYEYQLEDCYFRVMLDAVQEYVQSYGTSSYSQADIILGQQILEQIEYQQAQKKAAQESVMAHE